MGAVYLAEHQELRRKVAIKVLVAGRGTTTRSWPPERFLREARAAAALDHPNIVRIFDVARHNERPFLVMEYVEGETLQQTRRPRRADAVRGRRRLHRPGRRRAAARPREGARPPRHQARAT